MMKNTLRMHRTAAVPSGQRRSAPDYRSGDVELHVRKLHAPSNAWTLVRRCLLTSQLWSALFVLAAAIAYTAVVANPAVAAAEAAAARRQQQQQFTTMSRDDRPLLVLPIAYMRRDGTPLKLGAHPVSDSDSDSVQRLPIIRTW